MDYTVATENLSALRFDTSGNTDNDFITKVESALPIPKFKPKCGVRIIVTYIDRL